MTFSHVRSTVLGCVFVLVAFLAPSLYSQVTLRLKIEQGKAFHEMGWEIIHSESGNVVYCHGVGTDIEEDVQFKAEFGDYEVYGYDESGDGWSGGHVYVLNAETDEQYADFTMDAQKEGGSRNECPGPSKGGTFLTSFTLGKSCEKPEIFAQPISITSCRDEEVTFYVESSLRNGYYEWMLNGEVISVTNENWFTTWASEKTAGMYSVILRENCDPKGATVTSETAVLTLADAPVITAEPQTSIVLCESDNYELTVRATGTDLRYQWRKDGVELKGQNNPTFILNNAQASSEGTYDCVVTGQCVPEAVTSPITVAVVLSPRAISEPQDIFVCKGATASIAFVAAGSKLVYQWYKNGQPIADGGNSTLMFNNYSTNDNGTYQCVATSLAANPNNCNVLVRSRIVTVGAVEAPVVTKSPSATDACMGGTLTLVAEFKGNGLTYSWTRNGSVIASGNSNVLTIQNVASTDAGTYTVQATGACGLSATTTPAEVTVLAKPTVIAHPFSQNIPLGGRVELNVNATDWRTIQWYKNGVAIKGATSPTYTINDATAENSGYYNAIVNNTCGGVASGIARVNVSNPTVLAPELTVLSSTVNVGEIPFGYSSPVYTIERVITNTGNAPLEITNVSVAPSQYRVIAAPAAAFTVQPNQSVNVSIQVTPTVLGVVNGILSIQSNDSQNPNASVNLTATSVIRYTNNATESFGNVGIDKTANRCITVTNRWNNPIVIDQTNLGGADASLFTIKTVTPLTIAPGATSDICIDFAPATVGNKTATLSIKSANGGDATIALDGIGEPLTGIVDAVASGIRVAPNPMTDAVSVRFAEAVPTLNISVMNMAGETVAVLPATSVSAGESVQWNGSTTNGTSVANGMYTLIIRMGNNVTSVPVSVVK